MSEALFDEAIVRKGIALASEIAWSGGFKAGFLSVRHLTHSVTEVTGLARVMDQLGTHMGDPDLQGNEWQVRRNHKHIKDSLDRPAADWAGSMEAMFSVPGASQLWHRGLTNFVARLTQLPDDLDQAPMRRIGAPASSLDSKAAFRRAREYLISNLISTRSVALLVTALGLEIQVQSNKGFEADVWHDGSLFFMSADRLFVSGDGAGLASNFVKEEQSGLFSAGIGNMLGIVLATRLCHIADQAPSWRFFHPPW